MSEPTDLAIGRVGRIAQCNATRSRAAGGMCGYWPYLLVVGNRAGRGGLAAAILTGYIIGRGGYLIGRVLNLQPLDEGHADEKKKLKNVNSYLSTIRSN